MYNKEKIIIQLMKMNEFHWENYINNINEINFIHN